MTLRCLRCGTVVRLPGARLDAAALRRLAEHLVQAHPDVELPADAFAGDVLRHFVVVGAEA